MFVVSAYFFVLFYETSRSGMHQKREVLWPLSMIRKRGGTSSSLDPQFSESLSRHVLIEFRLREPHSFVTIIEKRMAKTSTWIQREAEETKNSFVGTMKDRFFPCRFVFLIDRLIETDWN